MISSIPDDVKAEMRERIRECLDLDSPVDAIIEYVDDVFKDLNKRIGIDEVDGDVEASAIITKLAHGKAQLVAVSQGPEKKSKELRQRLNGAVNKAIQEYYQ